MAKRPQGQQKGPPPLHPPPSAPPPSTPYRKVKAPLAGLPHPGLKSGDGQGSPDTWTENGKQPRPYGIEVQLVGLIPDLVQLVVQLVVARRAFFLSTFVNRKIFFISARATRKLRPSTPGQTGKTFDNHSKGQLLQTCLNSADVGPSARNAHQQPTIECTTQACSYNQKS